MEWVGGGGCGGMEFCGGVRVGAVEWVEMEEMDWNGGVECSVVEWWVEWSGVGRK